jgi:hypoxanthine-DNA glycosylase
VLLRGFPPVARRDARVLILGSMPSEASLADNFYYAHPSNAFWWLLAGVLDCAVPQGVAAKRRLLREHRIALWDVVHRCRRRGSLDAAIEGESVEANDLCAFLRGHPGITRVFFNGGAAEQLFRRHLRSAVEREHPRLRFARLPSSSPANASWSRARKLAAWGVVRAALEETVAEEEKAHAQH